MSIKLTNITKNYGSFTVLKDFDISFKNGEISCILGSSGIGKTTVLNIISGTTDYQGNVEYSGSALTYIFQKERLLNNLTVYKNLEYILKTPVKDKQLRQEKILSILKTVELSDKKDNYPYELSGGMQQRLSMARAFVYPSDAMLMDEPFRSLDIALKKRMTEAFLNLWRNDKRTVIFVTHDIDEALMLSDTVYIFKGLPAKVCDVIEIKNDVFTRDLTDGYMTDIRKKILNNII